MLCTDANIISDTTVARYYIRYATMTFSPGISCTVHRDLASKYNLNVNATPVYQRQLKSVTHKETCESQCTNRHTNLKYTNN